MFLRKIRLFTIMFTALFWSFSIAPVSAEQAKKAVILIIDDLEITDLSKPELVNFGKISNLGAVGLMNTRTQTLGFDNRASAYLTIGMGVRVSTTEQKRTSDIKALFDNLQKKYPNYTPGSIGETANKAGIKVAFIGNADTDRPSRYSLLMAADRSGTVDIVNTSSNLLINDKESVWGKRTNTNKLIEECRRALTFSNVIFVDFGDTTRLAEARERLRLDGKSLAKQRANALKNADSFLGNLIPVVVRESATLMIVSPTSPKDRSFSGIKNISPVLLYGEGFGKAVVSSNTTRRAGLISNIDLAPTIFHRLGVNIKGYKFMGEPAIFISANDPLGEVTKAYSEFVYLKTLRYIVHGIYVVLLLLAIYFLCIPVVTKRQYHTRMAAALAVMVVSVPLLSLILPIVIQTDTVNFSVIFVLLSAAAGFYFSKSVNRAINSLGAIATGTSLIMLSDLLSGRGHLLRTPLGFNDIFTGGRYYGLNNDSMGILLGSTAFALFFILEKYNPKKIIRLILAGVVLFITVLVQTPVYGANVGGTLAAMITAGIAGVVLIYRRSIGISTIPIVFMLVLAIELGISVADASGTNQTHAGKAVTALLTGGFGQQLIEIIASKLRVFLVMLIVPPWNILFFAQAYFCIYIFKNNADLLKVLIKKPLLLKSFKVIFYGAATAFLFNDTGIIATALMLTYTTMPLGVLLVRKGCELNEYTGEIVEKI